MTDFEYEPRERTILVPKRNSRLGTETAPFPIRVPELFGAIEAVERRGDYLVVLAEHGKASYHLVDSRANLGASNRVGYMAWKSLRKTIRELCLASPYKKRVDMHVLYYRNSHPAGSGSSADWASGRITVDSQVIEETNQLAFQLGKSLEAYLHLAPRERLASEDRIIRSFALLDRHTVDEKVSVEDPRVEDPLWRAFFELRTGDRGSV